MENHEEVNGEMRMVMTTDEEVDGEMMGKVDSKMMRLMVI